MVLNIDISFCVGRGVFWIEMSINMTWKWQTTLGAVLKLVLRSLITAEPSIITEHCSMSLFNRRLRIKFPLWKESYWVAREMVFINHLMMLLNYLFSSNFTILEVAFSCYLSSFWFIKDHTLSLIGTWTYIL
jgi:hypothetical protein